MSPQQTKYRFQLDSPALHSGTRKIAGGTRFLRYLEARERGVPSLAPRILPGWEPKPDADLFAADFENDVEVVLGAGIGRRIKLRRRIGDLFPDGIIQIPRCQGYSPRLDLALGVALGLARSQFHKPGVKPANCAHAIEHAGRSDQHPCFWNFASKSFWACSAASAL